MENNPDNRRQPNARGFAQSGVRIANERAVLTLIGLNPGSSNADLARMSGLGPQTTSRIVADLEARDLVTRGEVLRGRRGQPATPLFLNPDGAFSMGVDIGWRHFEVLLFGMSGKTLASVRCSYDYPDFGSIFDEIDAEIATIRAGMTPQNAARLVGLGVATPSNLQRSLEMLGTPLEQIPLWNDFDVVARFEQSTGLPTQWFNDGNAGGWCAFITQMPPRPRGVAYLQVGTFIGSGIAIDAVLWEGRTGEGANLGSILVTGPDGKPTDVHSVGSIMALQQRLKAAGVEQPIGHPLEWDWDAIEAVAGPWIEDAGKAVAHAIISARAMVDFDLAVVDGVMPRPIVERLLAQVEIYLANPPVPGVEIPALQMGRYGGSAAATGAAQQVLFQRFFLRAMNMFAT